ncbi:hypothetical protein SLE2022_036000 [Rubroshorea leprosula]
MASRVLKVKSADGEIFEVEEYVAEQFQMLKNLIEYCDDDREIPLNNVDGKTLAKMIEWGKKHADYGKGKKTEEDDVELKKWDEEFLDVHASVLYDYIMAANFLEIKVLLEQICDKVATMIRGKTPEQIRKILCIKNDFSPEQEEGIRKDNPWAFEQ